MINDFWLKAMDSLGSKKEPTTNTRYSRFLKREIYEL
jgi:hypothetical protein